MPSRRNYNSCKCPTLHGFRRNPVITSILVKWGRGGGGGRRGWGGITRDRRSFCRPRSEFHWTSNFLSHRRSSMRAYTYTFPSISPSSPCVCVFLSPFSSIFPLLLLFLSLSRTRILFLSPRFFFPLRRYFFLLVAHSFYASLPSLLWTYMRVSMRESPFTLLSISLPRFDGTFDALLYDWLLFFWFFFFFNTPFWLWTLLFSSSSLCVKRYGGRIILSKGLCCSRFQYFWD